MRPLLAAVLRSFADRLDPPPSVVLVFDLDTYVRMFRHQIAREIARVAQRN